MKTRLQSLLGLSPATAPKWEWNQSVWNSSPLTKEARSLASAFERSPQCSTAVILSQLATQAAYCLGTSPTAAPLGYELRAGPSPEISASSSHPPEYGLFLIGAARAGTLMTLYPGTLYLPGDDPILFPSLGNHFLLSLHNRGGTLDGRDSSLLSRFIYTSSASRDRYIRHFDTSWLHHRRKVAAFVAASRTPSALTPGDVPPAINPLGLGHFANHHPPTRLPSLAYISFNIPLDFPLQLSGVIPNVYWSPAHFETTSNVLTSAVALMTLRDVKDEELFVDYGFVGAAT